MKKSRNNMLINHTGSPDSNESSIKSPDSITTEVERAVDQQVSAASSPSSSSIKLTSKGAVQLTSSCNPKATTNAILNLTNNPFFHDKRKWDESFTVDEKKELTGNIVKAAKDNDGETYVTLQEEEYTVPVSSHEEDDSQESDDLDAINKKPGRKPMADEDALSDSDQDPKVKRKAQNRAAQRAFRERKERYVKELESKIKQVQDAHLVATAQLVRENQQLRAIIYRLESENYALKGIPMQPYQPPPPPPSTPSIPQQRNNSNYTNIAPLLPQTASSQPPLLLPAYLSNSPSPVSQQQPVSSILQSASPSVNQMMMLASNPLQQYPMSPVISAAIQNSQHISSPTTKPISKKVSSKQSKSTPPPNNQPLEYTFSISTPASLRPNGGSTSSSKHNRGEPIELVQLYPPGGNRNHQQNSATSPAATAADASPSTSNATLQKSDLIMLSPCNHNNNFAKKALSVTSVSSNGSCSTIAPFTVNTPASAPAQDDTCSVVSDKTISTVNTQTQYKKIQQLEIDMFDCHIDTEGQLFCEKLHNEVCNDAFDRLLSEPLFDQMGKLNLSISNYPVPIVTGPMSSMNTLEEEEEEEGASSSTTGQQRTTEDKHNNDKAKENNDDKQNDTKPLDDDMTKDSKKPSSEKRLLTCPEIWFILNQHGNFHKFTTDQLCQAVKELAKCADSGPVLEEPDLYQMLTKMDQGHL